MTQMLLTYITATKVYSGISQLVLPLVSLWSARSVEAIDTNQIYLNTE